MSGGPPNGLGGADLNLLLPLQVLLEERNVTRAGRRLSLSQPAMSAALARLRRRFDDELLVKAGRGYELTPFARELLPRVQHTVGLLAVALDVESAFDPRTCDRVFRVATTDDVEVRLLPGLFDLLRREAPGVRVVVSPLAAGERTPQRILDDADVVLAPAEVGLPGLRRPLWREEMVLIADPDADHPALAEDASAATLAELVHAGVSLGPGLLTAEERALGEAGLDRRLRVTAAGYLALPHVVTGTDLVALVPRSVAERHAAEGGRLRILPPPTGPIPLTMCCWFDRSRAHDPQDRWFHDCLERVARAQAAPSASGNIEGRAPVIHPTT
ncbi:LysR family transcriptional regulator [Nocardioides fonticola]|uniref:LysR family transcriptional regulator n=1 Tax=Nocardioides fonticola TaxID=450363 RepID=A0ABP7XE31_9ACTN